MFGFRALKSFQSPRMGRRAFAITRSQKHKQPPATMMSDFPLAPLASSLAPMRDFLNLFDTDLLPTFPSGIGGGQGGAMPLDIKETDKSYNVVVDVPGVDKKDINVSVRDNQLLVSAERSGMQKEENENFRRVERYYGHVSRTLNLPRNVDEHNIDAEYKDGVLHITIPKSESDKEEHKKIEVK